MYKEIHPLLLQYFNNDVDKMNTWLFTPNYLFGYFTPIMLLLTGDKRVVDWLKKQTEGK